jgi:hypothetical protein
MNSGVIGVLPRYAWESSRQSVSGVIHRILEKREEPPVDILHAIGLDFDKVT